MSESERYVLEFDEDSEEFNPASNTGSLDTSRFTYLIVDEGEKKMTINYRAGISIVAKRKIERRVNSYSKSGFSMGDKRIGLGFPLESVNAEEKLPDILLTHGHTFGRRLERDEIPPYAEPEPNMDIVPGSAAVKTDVSADAAKNTIKSDVPSAMPEKSTPPASEPAPPSESAPGSTPSPSPSPQPSGSGNSVEIKANSSAIQSSDDAVWALGQFIDQFVRQGKICVISFEETGKFRFVTLKDGSMNLDANNVEGNYRIDDVNLFEL